MADLFSQFGRTIFWLGWSERNLSGCPYAGTAPGYLALWLSQELHGSVRCSGMR